MNALDLEGSSFNHRTPDLEPALEQLLFDCIAEQRKVLSPSDVQPVADPSSFVSDAALESALQRARPAGDLRTDPDLGNCLVFHTSGLRGSVSDRRVTEQRVQIDALLLEFLAPALHGIAATGLRASGHYWYPPGTYMAWHTNSRNAGWRAYLTWADEPNRSCFRYLDPATSSTVTSWDEGWDLRVFKIATDEPFWHAVCSETDRFSFGYRILTAE